MLDQVLRRQDDLFDSCQLSLDCARFHADVSVASSSIRLRVGLVLDRLASWVTVQLRAVGEQQLGEVAGRRRWCPTSRSGGGGSQRQTSWA